MNLELSLFLGLLLHFVGDYLLQNDWMAQEKTKNWFPCFVHCLLYSLPFSFVLWQSPLLWVVFGTHFLIDRYRLAVYWIKLVNWNWDSKNFGYGEEKPMWMSVWLMIIVDNVFHVLINSLCIYLSFK